MNLLIQLMEVTDGQIQENDNLCAVTLKNIYRLSHFFSTVALIAHILATNTIVEWCWSYGLLWEKLINNWISLCFHYLHGATSFDISWLIHVGIFDNKSNTKVIFSHLIAVQWLHTLRDWETYELRESYPLVAQSNVLEGFILKLTVLLKTSVKTFLTFEMFVKKGFISTNSSSIYFYFLFHIYTLRIPFPGPVQNA